MGKFRLLAIVVLLTATVSGGMAILLKQNTSGCPIEITLPTPSLQIEIHVSGEVQNPGICIVGEDARVSEAIEAAGGFTFDADQSAVNLVKPMRDGAKIHVPKMGESLQRININTAEPWLLEALPGIGEAMAERIIDYRVTNGPFESPEDLKKVKGVGDSTFAKIESKITVY